jgi:hypothetical protein
MSSFLTLLELRKKQGRIETFVGKLFKNDPFITKNNKQFYANSVVFMSSDGKELNRMTPRSLLDSNKLIQYMKVSASPSNQIFLYETGNETQRMNMSNMKTTGEFGFKGSSYRDSAEDYEVTRCRVSLAKAIAQNHGPIILMVDNIRYFDICDVVSSYSKNSSIKTMADMAFIDRYANPVVWVANNIRDDSRTDQVSKLIIQSSQQAHEFISDIRAKYPDGLTAGTNLYRKFSGANGSTDRLKAVYGPYYDGSKRYSEQNVTAYCEGSLTVIRGSANTYRLSASGIKDNGDPVYGISEPVMMASYDSGKQDFGIWNAEISVDSLRTKTAKLF